MKTVGYIRVSTDEQSTNGVSLAEQRAKIEGYASLYGLTLVAVIEDAGQSAKSMERPGLRQALAVLKSGHAGAIVVAKLDRLTRSVRDLGQTLDEYLGSSEKCALLSVSEQIDGRSAGGRMVLNLLATVSQWERVVIGERTKAALAHLKRQNRRTGSIPFGKRLIPGTKMLEDEPPEQRIIAVARELRAAGNTLQGIADLLQERGHAARNGRKFAPAQVLRMMAS